MAFNNSASSFRRADIESRGTEPVEKDRHQEEVALSISPEEVIAALMGGPGRGKNVVPPLVVSDTATPSLSRSERSPTDKKKLKKSKKERRSLVDGSEIRFSSSKLKDSAVDTESLSPRTESSAQLRSHGATISTNGRAREGRSYKNRKSSAKKEEVRERHANRLSPTNPIIETLEIPHPAKKSCKADAPNSSLSSGRSMVTGREFVEITALKSGSRHHISKHESSSKIAGIPASTETLSPSTSLKYFQATLSSSSIHKSVNPVNGETRGGSTPSTSLCVMSSTQKLEFGMERSGSLLSGRIRDGGTGRSHHRKDYRSSDDDSIAMSKPVFRKAPSRLSSSANKSTSKGKESSQRDERLPRKKKKSHRAPSRASQEKSNDNPEEMKRNKRTSRSRSALVA